MATDDFRNTIVQRLVVESYVQRPYWFRHFMTAINTCNRPQLALYIGVIYSLMTLAQALDHRGPTHDGVCVTYIGNV